MASRVVDRDKGYKTVLKRYSALGSKLIVGVPNDGQMHVDTNLTVFDLAVVHEFGVPQLGIPERSFIRAWFDENEQKVRASILKMTQLVALGKYTQEQALNLLGQRWVAEIQKRIAARIPPPLKPATIDRKGSDVPLIDTGQLRSSITYIMQLANGVRKEAPKKRLPASGRARGRRRQ